MCGIALTRLPGSGILLSLKEDVMNMINTKITVGYTSYQEVA
jgi:hypothetical protein